MIFTVGDTGVEELGIQAVVGSHQHNICPYGQSNELSEWRGLLAELRKASYSPLMRPSTDPVKWLVTRSLGLLNILSSR